MNPGLRFQDHKNMSFISGNEDILKPASMKERLFFLILLLSVSGFTPVLGDETPVIGAYFYFFDDGYDNTMVVSDSIPWNEINRLYIAFATVRDGQLVNILVNESPDTADERIHTIVRLCREQNPDAEIFISSNPGSSVSGEYVRAADDPEVFAASVLRYLKEYNLDGYDMDWEDPDINLYSDEQTALLKACSRVFTDANLNSRDKPYGLTCTIWPGVHVPDDIAGFVPYTDQFNLMTYGPGNENDLERYAEEYNEAGVPYSMMIGGVESEIDYSENGGHDTGESIQKKAKVVSDYGMAGLMNWRIDNDMVMQNDDGVMAPTFQITDLVYRELTEL
jgi:hypothetical protein